jgi:hypothetical protein
MTVEEPKQIPAGFPQSISGFFRERIWPIAPALALTLTSPVFFDLARTNNVDWIPLLGFVIGSMWGLPLPAAKPQAPGGAADAFRPPGVARLPAAGGRPRRQPRLGILAGAPE